MVYRNMDKCNAKTSLLGFGCMRFPTDVEGKIDEAKAKEMIAVAMKNGVNYYDTAYPYHNGESELFTGKVLDEYPRDSYYLATKLPVWEIKSVDDAKKMFEKQLTRLHKDYVDFYLLHALDGERFKEMKELGVIEYFEEEKKNGRIRNYGFSFHDNYAAFEEILTYRDWDFVQVQYNYIDTKEQAGDKGYELAEKLGIPMVIMEPIRGGALAKLSPDLESLLKETGDRSVASYALRWVADHKNVKVILSGMSTMEQVTENLATFAEEDPLTETEKEAIVKVEKAIRGRMQNGCTGCRYCMPCPVGVDIPYSFQIWNRYHMFSSYDSISWAWETDMEAKEKPKNCIKCGKCEQACPQHIPIREHLKRVQQDIDEAKDRE